MRQACCAMASPLLRQPEPTTSGSSGGSCTTVRISPAFIANSAQPSCRENKRRVQRIQNRDRRQEMNAKRDELRISARGDSVISVRLRLFWPFPLRPFWIFGQTFVVLGPSQPCAAQRGFKALPRL